MEYEFQLDSIMPNVVANLDGEWGGNVIGVKLDNFSIAIDTTISPKSGALFRSALTKAFDQEIKYLILTHYHADHVFGAQAFRDIPIISSTLTMKAMQKASRSKWSKEEIKEWQKTMGERGFLFDGLEITFPTRTFEQNEKITDGDWSVELHHVGGHTQGSSYVHIPKIGLLITGDLVFANRLPYAADDTMNPDQWITQLEHFLSMDVKVIIPGHGPLVDKPEIQALLEFLKGFRDATKEAITAGKPFGEIKVPKYFTVKNKQTLFLGQKRFYTFYYNQMHPPE
ncbi:MAG: MBL fold metallo-hydrolase [Candidatus Ranarchaeia archaeon]|jgi:glyoxylase-like metal-dependent hydrolase (beta-lactamase superfamily II)